MSQPMQGDPDFVRAHEDLAWALECYDCASTRDWKVTLVFTPTEHPQISTAKMAIVECNSCGAFEEIPLVPTVNFFTREEKA